MLYTQSHLKLTNLLAIAKASVIWMLLLRTVPWDTLAASGVVAGAGAGAGAAAGTAACWGKSQVGMY